MTYYKELKRMNNALDEQIRRNEHLSVSEIIYNFTKVFEVSEKAVRRRLELLERMFVIRIEGDKITCLNIAEKSTKN